MPDLLSSFSFMQVLAARAISLPVSSLTSHSTYAQGAACFHDPGLGGQRSLSNGTGKLIFNSTVVNASPSPSVAA